MANLRILYSVTTLIVVIYLSDATLFKPHESLRNYSKRAALYAQNNISAPSECQNVKYKIQEKSIDFTWSAPKYTNGSLTGYQIDYQLRENKNWSPKKIVPLPNSTLWYSVNKNKTTNGWKIELRAYNQLPNGTNLYSKPFVLINGAGGIFLSTMFPSILAFWAVLYLNQN